MDEFIKNEKGPIITLEEALSARKTLDYYGSLGNTKNRFFILSEEMSPQPIEMSYGGLISVLKRLGKGNPIELVGGYFKNREKDYHYWLGCLGLVARMLKDQNVPIKIRDDLIF